MNQRSSIRKSQSKTKKLETKVLEQETRRMELKLQQLKLQMDLQRSQRDQKSQTGSRWKQSQNNVPLRGYGTKLLEDQKSLFKKHGVTPALMATKKSTVSSFKDTKSQSKQAVQLITSTAEDVEQAPVVYDLASKFGKAKITTQKIVVQDSVNKMLQQMGLHQYIQLFQQNHIYDIELINKQILDQMSVAPGHKIKILKKVNQIKQPTSMNQFINSQDKSSQQIQNINQKYQIESQQQQQQQQYNQLRSQNSIFQGQYDEQKNARQFQQAVLAFRKVNKQIQQIQIALQTQQIPKTQPIINTKYACFGCYKTFTNPPFIINNRNFCSQMCLNKYKISIQDKCPKCNKIFNKLEGFSHNGIRYCRIQCSPEANKIQQYFIKWRIEERNKQSS